MICLGVQKNLEHFTDGIPKQYLSHTIKKKKKKEKKKKEKETELCNINTQRKRHHALTVKSHVLENNCLKMKLELLQLHVKTSHVNAAFLKTRSHWIPRERPDMYSWAQ